MKQVLLLLLLIPLSLYSKKVDVKLSIEYKREKNYLELGVYSGRDSIDVPYLVIRYSNDSDDYLYLKKVIYNENNLPEIAADQMVSQYVDLTCIVDKLYKRPINDKCYYVVLYNYSNITTFWELISDISTLYKERCSEDINNNLNEINSLVVSQAEMNRFGKHKFPCFTYPYREDVTYTYYKQEYLYKNKQSYLYSIPEELTDEFLKTRKDIVFLSPNSIHKEEYSLISFPIIGGEYIFKITETKNRNKIYQNLIDGEVKKIKLPSKVGKYKIFKNRITTNEVKLRTSK